MKKNKITEITDWTKWGYENNAPMTLLKMGFMHSLTISVFVVLMSVFLTIMKYSAWQDIVFILVVITFTTGLFLLFSTIPFALLHGLHYKVFKKLLLSKKLEQLIIIAWSILFTHYLMVYYLIDFLFFNLKFKLSTIEITVLSSSYLVGLMVSFFVFNKKFYEKKKIDDRNINLWKKYVPLNKNYF
ncbi:hypothetical protein GW796_06085 [archaeon]|nr:hypothetical protein [archaeon]